jgi:hypothetical protein
MHLTQAIDTFAAYSWRSLVLYTSSRQAYSLLLEIFTYLLRDSQTLAQLLLGRTRTQHILNLLLGHKSIRDESQALWKPIVGASAYVTRAQHTLAPCY